MARSIFFYTDSRVLGGAENAMLMLLGSLDREAWVPTLLLEEQPGAEALADRAAAIGVPVRHVPPLPLGLAGARRVPAMARLLRHERPDVFHAHMSSPVACKWGLTAAVLARVPAVVGTVQVGAYTPPNRSAYRQLWALARGVDRFLAVSREIADELIEVLGWPAEKIEVIHNAVDVAAVVVPAPPGLREQLGGDETRPLVLTPARLDEQKGHPILLEAIAEVPDALFLLAGEGPEREALEARAGQLGLADRVRFLGRREDMPQLLAACDVFALPSLYEGSSLAVLEAMAAGIPIVSSAIGGTEELIEDGRSGVLVPPGDPQALAASLRRVLGDSDLRRSLANRARERVDSGLTREKMGEKVDAVYRELLGDGPPAADGLPEARRNPLLRREDWRFLLPDAKLLARWRLPLPGRAGRARRRFEAEGFNDVRVYWAGPLPRGLPQFWLPVDSAEAVEHLLSSRAPRSTVGILLRSCWRLARWAGLLAPLYVVGREETRSPEELPLPSSAPLLLLTTGHRSINKAVGLAFEAGTPKPIMAAKFARVPESEPGLRHEADVLARIGAEHPSLTGIPHFIGSGERCNRFAVIEGAVEGSPLLEQLEHESFADLSERVTRLLIELAGGGADPTAPDDRRQRLVEAPLRRLEADFGSALQAGTVARARELLQGFEGSGQAIEHRDCSPWNIVVGVDGEPILLDWESAELDGLPGMDLVYFLANSAFVLDRAIESGRTRESYRLMLDDSTAHGKVAAAAMRHYRETLAIDAEDMRRIRLLCWIVHCRSDYRHLELEAGGPPSEDALRSAPFLGLVEEELAR